MAVPRQGKGRRMNRAQTRFNTCPAAGLKPKIHNKKLWIDRISENNSPAQIAFFHKKQRFLLKKMILHWKTFIKSRNYEAQKINAEMLFARPRALHIFKLWSENWRIILTGGLPASVLPPPLSDWRPVPIIFSTAGLIRSAIRQAKTRRRWKAAGLTLTAFPPLSAAACLKPARPIQMKNCLRAIMSSGRIILSRLKCARWCAARFRMLIARFRAPSFIAQRKIIQNLS